MATIARNDRYSRTADKWESQIEDYINRAVAAKQISKNDEFLIRGYITLKKGGNVELSTLYNITRSLLSWRKFMPAEYRKATIEDLLAAKVAMEVSTDADGNPAYAPGYRRLVLMNVKAFFRWGNRDKQQWSKVSIPQLSEDFKPASVNPKSKKLEDIMTADEVARLIDAADNSRDRAMLSLQYECALRAVDLGRLKWGDITQISERESSIVVDSKTKFERHISVVLYNGYLNAWKRDATNADDKDGFVFLTRGGNNRDKQITYTVVRDAVKACADRAVIKGRMNTPHTLRHSRITYWLQHDVAIAKICKMAWGVAYSPMIKTYEHLGHDEAAKEQRRLAGIKDDEIIQVGDIQLRVCPVCGLNSPPGSKPFCPGCGSPLDEKAAAEARAQREQDRKAADLVLETLLKRIEALEKAAK